MAETKTIKEFIEEAVKIHGDKFDYSNSVYINGKSPITIRCKLHGDVVIYEARKHVRIQDRLGCKHCSKYDNTDKYIAKVRKVHGDRYDYSKLKYIDHKTSVLIICKKHGEFYQKPQKHNIHRKGCPTCGAEESSGWSKTSWLKLCEKNNEGNADLYIIKCFNETEEFYKIGITCKNLKDRFKHGKIPYKYEIVYTYSDKGEKIYDIEKELHRQYKSLKYTPLIKFGGHTECFSSLEESSDFWSETILSLQ